MVSAVTAALLLLRRLDAVLNAQFFAEDGKVWYEQAYNDGLLRSLFQTYSGYFHAVPRLTAIVALGVPLGRAPLVMNLIALAVEALPALFLVSPRMRNAGSLAVRCVLALLYLAVPNVPEVHATITNAQWHLSILAFLVIVAEAPQSRTSRGFDLAVMVLAALSGPFCIVLLPIAVLVAAVRRQVWNTVVLSVLGGGGVVQGLAILLTGSQRIHQPLGASFQGLCRIVAGQIVLPVLLGRNRLNHLAHSPGSVTVLACLLTAVTGLLFLYALRRGSLELRSFILFALLVLAASLASPTANASSDHWGPMQAPGAATRYWYVPELAVMTTLLWLLGRKRPAVLRAMAVVFVCLMAVGMVKHWRYTSFPDLRFADFARQFEHLPSGARMEIPINPTGWSMSLVKK